jgi:hypothetical protein
LLVLVLVSVWLAKDLLEDSLRKYTKGANTLFIFSLKSMIQV